jgi:hypothetical protein
VAAAVPIPTLETWALLALLAGFAVLGFRRIAGN